MLAVLPFQNLAGAAGHDYLSDGLTEQTIHEFARARPERLGVIARTTAMTYKGKAKPIAQVGRELGVEYVLEGSLKEGCSSLSVAARLVRVRDEAQVWSESFDVAEPDALKAQSEAAERISSALRARLIPLDRQDVVGA
jgi:TolB-like protein